MKSLALRLLLAIFIFVSGMTTMVVFPVASQAVSDAIQAAQACDEIFIDSSLVSTPDPRRICKRIVQVEFHDLGTACEDFTDARLTELMKLDPNKVDRIVRHGEKDGTAYQLIMRGEGQVLFVPFGAIEVNNQLYGQNMWLWLKGGTWRCKTLKRMLEEKSGQTSQPATTPSTCPRSLSDLKQFGSIVKELEFPPGTLAGAVMRLSQESSQKLSSCGWTIQGDNPEIKSVWSPNNLRPLPR